MQTVTLAAQDFKTIHNTLCDLRSVVERMTHSMIKIEDVQQIIEGFEQGLADAYSQDNDAFESKMEYFSEFQQANGLASVWSIYDLDLGCFEEAHPYASDAFVVYRDHWGDVKDTHYPVTGTTWGDVYRAADLAVRASGDSHHIFIESFAVQGLELRLSTGS